MPPRKSGETKLNQKIQKLAEQQRILNIAIARHVGVDPKRITKWFQGEGTPDGYQLKKIADLLKVPMDYLVDDGRDDPPPPGEHQKGTVLSEDEQHVLFMVRAMGTQEAVHRLTQTRPPVVYNEPPRPQGAPEARPEPRSNRKSS